MRRPAVVQEVTGKVEPPTDLLFHGAVTFASSRSCPRCGRVMLRWNRDKVVLESCPACRGSFLDPGKLVGVYGAVADPAEWVDMGLAVRVGPTAWVCPAHIEDPAGFDKYEISYQKHRIEIEACAQCGGIWLDFGEGPAIKRAARHLLRDRQAAGDKLDHPALFVFQLLTGFPVEVWNPTKRRPFGTLALMAALAALLLAGWFIPALDVTQASARAMLAFVPATFFAGESPWTVVTYSFLHFGIWHLASNLYFLWIYGDNIEDLAGRLRFFGIFFGGAIVGALLEGAVAPMSSAFVLGASGGISTLMGAYVVLFPRTRVQVVWAFLRFSFPAYAYGIVWVAMQIGFALLDFAGVAWFAHLGGMLVGLLSGVYLRRRHLRRLIGTSGVVSCGAGGS